MQLLYTLKLQNQLRQQQTAEVFENANHSVNIYCCKAPLHSRHHLA